MIKRVNVTTNTLYNYFDHIILNMGILIAVNLTVLYIGISPLMGLNKWYWRS